MKITLGRILLILTTICIILGWLHLINFNYGDVWIGLLNYLDSVGYLEFESPKNETYGMDIGFCIGFTLQMLMIVVAVFTFTSLWDYTKYKE